MMMMMMMTIIDGDDHDNDNNEAYDDYEDDMITPIEIGENKGQFKSCFKIESCEIERLNWEVPENMLWSLCC